MHLPTHRICSLVETKDTLSDPKSRSEACPMESPPSSGVGSYNDSWALRLATTRLQDASQVPQDIEALR